jgi:hypothetical protein
MAGVVEMSSVMGGWSFLTRRGSYGERDPNYIIACASGMNIAPTIYSVTHQLDDFDEHPVV